MLQSSFQAPSREIVNLLGALSSGDSTNHHANLSTLENLLVISPCELISSLCRVLMVVNIDGVEVALFQTKIRPLAGLILKNFLSQNKISVDILFKVNSEVESCLLDLIVRDNENDTVQNIVGSCISAVYSRKEWPQLFNFIGINLESENRAVCLRMLATLEKVTMDCSNVVEPATLVPKLLLLLDSDDMSKIEGVLKCIKVLIPAMPSSLAAVLQKYIQKLGEVGARCQACLSVEALVCSSFMSLLSLHTACLSNHFSWVCEFILASSSATPPISLEACEFWLTLSSVDVIDMCTPDMIQILQVMLPRLLPVLLQNMVYTKEEIEEFALVEDPNKPVFYTSKVKRNLIEEEDDEEEDDDEVNSWTLRKCCAASLDALSNLYGSEVFCPILLPTLQQSILHNDPWIQEASILALGAIAMGCSDGMKQHLPTFFPILFNTLSNSSNPQQLLIISCWTIGRYAQDYIQNQPSLLEYIWSILSHIILQSTTPRVQLAACSAWIAILESAYQNPLFSSPHFLSQMYQALLHSLTCCISTRSKLVLFDTFGVLAEYLGPKTAQANLPELYIPPLLQLWSNHSNKLDKELLPLMESLCSISLAIGLQTQPFSQSILQLSLQTIDENIIHLNTIQSNISEEETDHLVCSLDILDALVEALGGINFKTLLSSTEKNEQPFLNALLYACQSQEPPVRMSAYALVGDIARQCPSLLQDSLSHYITELIRSIHDPIHASVCNNAVWAMGEICLQCIGNPHVLHSFAPSIVSGLIPLLVGNSTDNGLTVLPGLPENSATSMGRLAKVDASFVTNDLDRFFSGWCEGLARISDPTEKRDGFQGLLLSIQQAVASPSCNIFSKQTCILSLIFAIISWHIKFKEEQDEICLEMFYSNQLNYYIVECSDPELRVAFSEILRWIKEGFFQQWEDIMKNNFPVCLRKLLTNFYNV